MPVSIFAIIIATMLGGGLVWLWQTYRLLRGSGKVWKIVLMGVPLMATIGLLMVLLSRRDAAWMEAILPRPILSFVFIWNLLVLPGLLVAMLIAWTGKGARSLLPSHRTAADVPAITGVTRRDFLTRSAAAAPAIIAGAATGVSHFQLEHFRTRHISVTPAALPESLDGLTIAHLSDLHIGRFTRGKVMERIIEETNALKADLVLLTGDLINFQLSDLSPALELVGALRGNAGVFMCEGNHDLFQDAAAFRRQTRAAGIALLVNESATIHVRGESIQVLGQRWGGISEGDVRHHGDEGMRESFAVLRKQLQPDAFRILLAHHPHVFDHAAEVPLVVAGHTHGGQIMFGRDTGFGPMLFRYWSGLYMKDQRALVVSNGVGNWFPIRTSAPAEIVHITLRRPIA